MPIRFVGGIGPAQILTVLVDTIPPKMQTDAVLHQVGPVQNTWYTVLNTTSVRVLNILAVMETTGENIEVEVTIDGKVFTADVAAVLNTYYFAHFTGPGLLPDMTLGLDLTTVSMLEHRPFFFDCGTLLVRIRKVSNNGAGHLLCGVSYQKWS